jgi:hypothetical protein
VVLFEATRRTRGCRREDTRVPKKGHTEGADPARFGSGRERNASGAEICREHGIIEATYYIWKKKYSGLGLSELRELRQLREENAKLKRWSPTFHWTGTSCRRSCKKARGLAIVHCSFFRRIDNLLVLNRTRHLDQISHLPQPTHLLHPLSLPSRCKHPFLII